jgi:acyl-CoA reductase-like NAD-dependent aldehyde dehydrogenase
MRENRSSRLQLAADALVVDWPADPPENAMIVQEEQFGPIVQIIVYDDLVSCSVVN